MVAPNPFQLFSKEKDAVEEKTRHAYLCVKHDFYAKMAAKRLIGRLLPPVVSIFACRLPIFCMF